MKIVPGGLKVHKHLYACWKYWGHETMDVIRHDIMMNRETREVTYTKNIVEYPFLKNKSNIHDIKSPAIVVHQDDVSWGSEYPGVKYNMLIGNVEPEVYYKILVEKDGDKRRYALEMYKGEDYLGREICFIPIKQIRKWRLYNECLYDKVYAPHKKFKGKIAWLVPTIDFVIFYHWVHIRLQIIDIGDMPQDTLVAGYTVEPYLYVSKPEAPVQKAFLGINYKPVFKVPFEDRHYKKIIKLMNEYLDKQQGGES